MMPAGCRWAVPGKAGRVSYYLAAREALLELHEAVDGFAAAIRTAWP